MQVIRASDILGAGVDELLDRADEPPREERTPRRAERPEPARDRSASRSRPAAARESTRDRVPEPPAPEPPAPKGTPPERTDSREPSDHSESDGFARLFVNVGRNEGVRPRDLKTLLSDGGIHPDDVEQVAVKERHSFVTVVEDLEQEAIDVLCSATFAGSELRAERARPRRER